MYVFRGIIFPFFVDRQVNCNCCVSFFFLCSSCLEIGCLGAGKGTRLRRNALRPGGCGGLAGRTQEDNRNEYHPIFRKHTARIMRNREANEENKEETLAVRSTLGAHSGPRLLEGATHFDAGYMPRCIYWKGSAWYTVIGCCTLSMEYWIGAC